MLGKTAQQQTSQGLDRAQIAYYKQKMLAGDEIPEIGAYYDPRTGTFYITDGHHRVNAALEIFEETGNMTHLLNLLFTPLNRGNFQLPPPGFWGGQIFPR